MSPQLHLPLNSPLPGSELTKEPFRWDQRLFALVLRMPGAAVPDTEQLGSVPSDESAITQMCEVTGGTSTTCLKPSLDMKVVEESYVPCNALNVLHTQLRRAFYPMSGPDIL